VIACHGGAGLVTEDRHARLRAGVRAAAEAGHAILADGGSALDAVVAAVRVLEDDPEFNAGTGSALTSDGTVETDASVMDGATQRVGAVGAVPDLGNAVALARAVLDANVHVLLAGREAWRFAHEVGITPAAPDALVTERQRMRLAALTSVSGGTVGAVARDRAGRFAAATSTGGIVGKRPGRIGDSPIPGAGTWADARCAISATGDGEAILRVALARSISMRVDQRLGRGLETAVIDSLDELRTITEMSAGVIAIDSTGFIARQLSPTMPIAWISEHDSGDSMGMRQAGAVGSSTSH
jgi:beta-aspartyl-peptidase (threonine type)